MKNGPSRIKYKKVAKGRLKAFCFNEKNLKFGILGLKSLEAGIIKSKQIESARQTVARKTKRNSKVWIKIFPSTPITKKSIGTRMGKGKGAFSHWGAKVSCGTTIFEICGSNTKILLNALIAGSKKLPVKTKIFN
jgi:large subunit ribosomal protein L16